MLAKVIREEDMPGLVDAQITREYFIDEEHLQVFDWMRGHYREYGKAPGLQALRDNYPTWKCPDTPEPLTYYVDKLRLAYRYDLLQEAVSESAALLSEDAGNTDEAQLVLARSLTEISDLVNPLRDHDLTDPKVFAKTVDFYRELTENPGDLRGLATGWPTIDLATMGLQPGQLTTFVGPPKGGKSTVMLSAADEVSLQGEDVLFVSFEMSYEEMQARWVGKRAGTNYRRLLKGKMNKHDTKRLDKLDRQLRTRPRGRFVLSEDVSSTTTVSGIIAKVQQYKPRVLFIDGVYLMDDETGEPKGSSQAITNITRSLKRVAQLFQISIVISTQTLYSKMRGQTIKASSIGYSSSFGQDSDAVIATEIRDGLDGAPDEHFLKILLSRSGPMGVETRINFDWETSQFSEFASTAFDEADPDEHDTGEIRVGVRNGRS